MYKYHSVYTRCIDKVRHRHSVSSQQPASQLTHIVQDSQFTLRLLLGRTCSVSAREAGNSLIYLTCPSIHTLPDHHHHRIGFRVNIYRKVLNRVSCEVSH